MRIIFLYRPNSDHARRVEEYVADFNRFHPSQTVEVCNVDSSDGAHVAEVYGVMEYPSILALKDDGQILQQWQGADKLPLMNDLVYYAQQ